MRYRRSDPALFCSSIVGLALAGVSLTTPVYGQAPLAPSATAPSAIAPSSSALPAIDPRPRIGAVVAIGGAVIGFAGVVMLATTPKPVPQQPGSCCTGDAAFVPISGTSYAGAGLLAGGIALAAVGVPLYFATANRSSPSQRDDSRLTTGIVLTTIGLALVAGGTGVFVEGTTVRSGQNTNILNGALVSGPMLLVGTIATSIGISLWAKGANPSPALTLRQPWVIDPELSIGAQSVGLRFRF